MTETRVFISYSHDSPEHENQVLELSDRLREDGIDANIDQYQSNPPEGWQLWMEKEIRDSQFVLLVCTETCLKRVMKEDDGKGKGVMWESAIIYTYLYEAGVVNEKFIPIVFGHENTKHTPTPLKPTTFYDVSTEEGYELLYRRLTNQPYTPKPILGKKKKLPPKQRKQRTSEINVSLAKLPSTSPDLFGREKELKELDQAWENDNINIFTLVAWGGVGKSALVNKWLLQMARDNFRGAERIFGWSFYSQGAAEGRQVSADQFIAAALEWFGDPDPNHGSPWDKGERLAELVKASRALVVLDGLEPLQNPPPVETGRIKDPALVSFLREVAVQNPGLVVITTRLAVEDLEQYLVARSREAATSGSVIERDLENLSEEAGAAYLSHLGVDGTEAECRQAAREFGGHALALTLLGGYLKVVHRGDIRKRGEIPRVMDERKQGAHARWVMASYEVFLEGKPELDILRLMGLFDRPAEGGALEALRRQPVIEGLTENIETLSEADWQYALDSLRELHLIARGGRVVSSDSEGRIETTNAAGFDTLRRTRGYSTSGDDDELDCHPLLREHFGEQLKEKNPAAWREANNRLYEYYQASAKEYPDTLQEMAPLFAAVMHGCQAGKYQEAYDEVYRKRIRRGNEQYQLKKLGAFGADLAALSGFFDGTSWHKPVDELREDTKGWLLNAAGFHLRALGRLAEAAQPMQASLDIDVDRKEWKGAAISASNLSELTLTIGDVKQALAYAEQSVGLADQSGDEFDRMDHRTLFAYTLNQLGRASEAKAIFREAEEMQKKRQPQLPLLYSVPGFRYCDLFLSEMNYAEVERRASQTLEWAKQYGLSLLTIALDNLSLGRAKLLHAMSLRGSHPAATEAIPNLKGEIASPPTGARNDIILYLNRAVDGLRQAGQQHELPRGLLARAEVYRVTGNLHNAQKDLEEAFSIASRGGMGLYLADCHLEYARLYMSLRGAQTTKQSPDGEGKVPEQEIASQSALAMTQAREHLKTAKEMIAKMGYHRRDHEVEELEEQLK